MNEIWVSVNERMSVAFKIGASGSFTCSAFRPAFEGKVAQVAPERDHDLQTS